MMIVICSSRVSFFMVLSVIILSIVLCFKGLQPGIYKCV